MSYVERWISHVFKWFFFVGSSFVVFLYSFCGWFRLFCFVVNFVFFYYCYFWLWIGQKIYYTIKISSVKEQATKMCICACVCLCSYVWNLMIPTTMCDEVPFTNCAHSLILLVISATSFLCLQFTRIILSYFCRKRMNV